MTDTWRRSAWGRGRPRCDPLLRLAVHAVPECAAVPDGARVRPWQCRAGRPPPARGAAGADRLRPAHEKQFAEAIAEYDRALELDPENVGALHYRGWAKIAMDQTRLGTKTSSAPSN